MIIKSYEVHKIDFLKFNFFLLYGKNEGLKREIINEKLIKEFKGQINKYENSEFINNYELILDEILNKSLFEDEKIIIINRVNDKLFKYLEEITLKNIIDVKIILNSENLDKKSKLRIFFEKNKNLITIPIYEDNIKSLTDLAIKYLNQNNIKISRESLNLLVNRASGDRDNLKIELEKIYNYSISNKSIDLKTVEKLSNLAENYSVNELADSYLSRNKKNISKILNENYYSDEDCIMILRTILSKSKRLINIIERYNESKNLETVLSSTKPPIFWKDKEQVKFQATNWDLDDLKNNTYKLNGLETLVKTNSKNSLNIVSDFIINC